MQRYDFCATRQNIAPCFRPTARLRSTKIILTKAAAKGRCNLSASRKAPFGSAKQAVSQIGTGRFAAATGNCRNSLCLNALRCTATTVKTSYKIRHAEGPSITLQTTGRNGMDMKNSWITVSTRTEKAKKMTSQRQHRGTPSACQRPRWAGKSPGPLLLTCSIPAPSSAHRGKVASRTTGTETQSWTKREQTPRNVRTSKSSHTRRTGRTARKATAWHRGFTLSEEAQRPPEAT